MPNSDQTQNTSANVTAQDLPPVPEVNATSPTSETPLTFSSKKKSGRGKVVATIIGLVLLVFGIAAGIILTQNQQIFQEKAAAPGTCTCKNKNGTNAGPGSCSGSSCDCSPYQVKSNACGQVPAGGGGTTAPGNSKAACEGTGKTPTGNFWCAGCGGFCLSGSYKGGGCNQAQMEKCGQPAQYGAKVVACNTTHAQACYCDITTGTGSVAPLSNVNTPTCFDVTGSCGATDGLCAVAKNFGVGGSAGGTTATCGTVTKYYCDKNVNLSGGKSCDTSTGGKVGNPPPGFCGTIQVDTACQGFKTTVIPCTSSAPGTTTTTTQTLSTPTPTPTPTPVPQCNSVCSSTSQCSTGLICNIASGATSGFCRNASCTTSTSCVCSTATPVSTPTPTPTPTPTSTTVTTTSISSCGGVCSTNNDCASNMVCYSGVCRNQSCTTSASCVCATVAPLAAATPVPPTLPQSGTDWPTYVGGGLGIIVILASLLMAL